MKAIRVAMCAVALALTLVGCQAADPPVAESPTGAMKGYELYSWQHGGIWRFSILVGTNREKTLAEIQSSETTLDGTEALQTALDGIAAGQFLTWLPHEGLAFPPRETVERVEQMCRDRGLQLTIAR